MPTTIMAVMDPSSTVGTSAYTISHATDSLQQVTLRAGFSDLQVRFKVVPTGNQAYWVVCWKVFLMISGGNHPKRGWRRTKSGSFLRIDVADVMAGDYTIGGVFSSVTCAEKM
jgi:hypothetical protein